MGVDPVGVQESGPSQKLYCEEGREGGDGLCSSKNSFKSPDNGPSQTFRQVNALGQDVDMGRRED